jgi:hypothetical protein
MAGNNFARRTVGVTRIRIAGEDGPPVADASMAQIYPAISRQIHRSSHRRLRVLTAPPRRHAD